MLSLDGHSLNIKTLVQTARNNEEINLSPQAIESIKKSQERLNAIIAQGRPVYGLNTGFGIFADRTITPDERQQLNRNLILSHAVAMGEALPDEVVRTAMLIRANTLSKGYSGISQELVQTLLDMLNRGVTPVIQSKGSLGSSGDLCMLAQMAMVASRMDGEKESETGQAFFNDRLFSGREAMQNAGIQRLVLTNKDGLALINGATFSTAVLALAAYDSCYLCRLADLAAALTFEALLARTDPLHPQIHAARGLSGQIEASANMAYMLDGSTFVNSHNHVQDAYSLRCAPQVHGAVRDTLGFVWDTVTREINAATDNPLVVEDGMAISGGNFHGEAVGMGADYLGIALSELAGISERRTFRLMDERLNNGLPSMLVGDAGKAGLNSGIMMLQYTAAALALENQTLSSPDSVRSLPTSANQEDFNANASNAANHARQILENVSRIIAIEIYSACRAIDLRKTQDDSLKLGKQTGAAFGMIRALIPFKQGDAYWKAEVDLLYDHLFEKEDFRNAFYDQGLTKP